MGLIKLSQKVKRSPIFGTRYWYIRDMENFMPTVAYDVPVEGKPPAHVIDRLYEDIVKAELAANPDEIIGVHIDVHDHAYITVTLGTFET